MPSRIPCLNASLKMTGTREVEDHTSETCGSYSLHQPHQDILPYEKHCTRYMHCAFWARLMNEELTASYLMQEELRMYSPELLEKPALVVANKIDRLQREGHTLPAIQRRTPLEVVGMCALPGSTRHSLAAVQASFSNFCALLSLKATRSWEGLWQ